MKPTYAGALLLGLSAVLTVGNASADFAPSPFCADPYQTICGTPFADTAMSARSARIEQLKTRIRRTALQQTIDEYGRDILGLSQIENWLPAMIGYLEKVDQATLHELTPVELGAVLGNFEKLRSLVRESILDRMADSPSLLLRGPMLTLEIQKVRIVTAFELRIFEQLPSPDMKSLAVNFQATCGPDGLRSNAFAFKPSDTYYVIVCPGALIAAIGSGANAEENFLNLLHLVPHELGHSIDAASYPEVYPEYRSCLTTGFGDELLLSRADQALVTTLAPSGREAQDAFRRALSVAKHSQEITADYWAVQAMAHYLSTAGATLSMTEKTSILRHAWSPQCGTGDEGIHPSGKFRIETLLRGDPGISRIMGCGDATQLQPVRMPARMDCALNGMEFEYF